MLIAEEKILLKKNDSIKNMNIIKIENTFINLFFENKKKVKIIIFKINIGKLNKLLKLLKENLWIKLSDFVNNIWKNPYEDPLIKTLWIGSPITDKNNGIEVKKIPKENKKRK